MDQALEGRLAVLREQSRKGLRYLLNYMLTNAEHFLLAQASKAERKAEQTNIYQALRELRLKSGALEKRFFDAVMAGYEGEGALAAPPAPAPARPVDPAAVALDGNNLSLMHEHRLEEELAVENLAGRARHSHRDALLELARHVAAQTGQRRVDVDALPVGPVALASSFVQACADIEVSASSRIVFLKLFTRFIIDELGPFYADCLAALPVEQDVAAEQARVAAIEAQAPELLPTGQRREDHGDADVRQAQPEMFWDSARTPLLAAPGRAMAMPRSVLDESLFRLQQQLLDRRKMLGAINPKAGIQPFEVFELINGVLEEEGYTKPMALAADVIETVNLVRLLFDVALRDTTVPMPVRRLVRLLQIPVLRAALQDPEVLSDAGHPVRALFSDMGSVAVGWTPAGDLADDELFRKLQSITARIVAGYGTDPALFLLCRDEMKAQLRCMDSRTRVVEQRTLSAEFGRTEREAARADIARMVASAMGAAPLPQRLTGFLLGTWSDALLVTRLREGEESGAWGDCVVTTGKLVAAARQGNVTALKALAEPVRQALRVRGLDEDAITAQLRGLEEAVARGVPAQPGVAAAPELPELERPAASPEYLQIADRLAPDTWIEFRVHGHPPARVRLLTKFPKTGEFLFVNRDGAKASDWKRDDLAAAMQSGEAVILTGPNAPSAPSASMRWSRR